MTLIEHYIMREIRRLVRVIVGFLIFIFAIYSAQRYLTEAANGTLALKAVAAIVFYKVLIALEMLLPVGLYVAAAVALGQLYSNSEITALFAAGISPLRIYKAVLTLAIPLAILVTALSLVGRPWAYAQIDLLRQDARSTLDVGHLQAQKFNLDDNGSMILAQQVDRNVNHLSDTLIYRSTANVTRVLRAHSASVAWPGGVPVVTLQDGSAYSLDHQGMDDNQHIYHRLQLYPKPAKPDDDARSKSLSVRQLAASSAATDAAELQWRESRGITTLLMALMAVSLSRLKPRQGRFTTLLPLALVFTLIFFGGNVCRTLVAAGTLPALPGVWLFSLLMLVGVVGLVARDVGLLPTRSR